MDRQQARKKELTALEREHCSVGLRGVSASHLGRGRRTRRDEAVWRRRRVRRPRPTLGTLTYEKEKERNA